MADKRSARALARRTHHINIEELIVHRYAAHDVLLKKADKIARDIITGEMREGEMFRTRQAGLYQLVFPKLTPEAGALRCSLIAEKVYREVRRINPSSAMLDGMLQNAKRPEPKRAGRVLQRGAPARPAQRQHAAGGPTSSAPAERVVHETATRAFERMISTGAGAQAADMTLTADERRRLADMRLRFHPVWHIRNNMITSYRCVLWHDGRDLTPAQATSALGPGPGDLMKAKIDAAVYAQAVAGLQHLLQQGQKAVLIVPMHYSTVDQLRFMAPLLEAGSALPEEAISLLVFELLDIPQSTSRFRLREPVAYLRTRSRALLGRIGLDFTNLDVLRELNFHGISLDLDEYRWSESQLLPLFDAFVSAGQKQKLHSFVHGIRTPSLTIAAISAGFTYVGGPAVSEPRLTPSAVQSFGLQSLYPARNSGAAAAQAAGGQ